MKTIAFVLTEEQWKKVVSREKTILVVKEDPKIEDIILGKIFMINGDTYKDEKDVPCTPIKLVGQICCTKVQKAEITNGMLYIPWKENQCGNLTLDLIDFSEGEPLYGLEISGVICDKDADDVAMIIDVK